MNTQTTNTETQPISPIVELEVATGHEVAKLLNLKFGKDGRTKTSWGTKSIQGLGACIIRIVEEQAERLRK